MSESQTEKDAKATRYRAIRAGRKPFRGYPPERAAGKQGRKNMMRVFWAKGLYTLAERLHKLRASGARWDVKSRRFQVILDKYAGAVTGT